MEIRSLGRSGFEVKSSVGTVLVDPPQDALSGPFPDPNTIIAFSKRESRRTLPNGVAKMIEGPGEYEIGSISIRGVATPADDPESSREINTAYLIDADGVFVCSTGGLGSPPDTVAMQQLGKVNVLLLDPEQSPMSADELAATMRNFEPDVVVPSGYDSSAAKPGTASAKNCCSPLAPTSPISTLPHEQRCSREEPGRCSTATRSPVR